MEGNSIQNYLETLIENMPTAWLDLTTHRLDIYDESLAKSQFLAQFEVLFNTKNSDTKALQKLPTAYDYIRLGHPLSCLLEWSIAKLNTLKSENVISFSSQTMPILAILRTNAFADKKTQILYSGTPPSFLDTDVLTRVYGYQFELKQLESSTAIPPFDGSTVFIAAQQELSLFEFHKNCDFVIHNYGELGSILAINGAHNEASISAIQHVRRRETIAMTPAHSLTALKRIVGQADLDTETTDCKANKTLVLDAIQKITGTSTTPLVGSSGLSIQYAIMMGLVHDALDTHPGKPIKIVVPPNCYGGTNDQARRVAACLKNVEVVDLLVDGENDMVQSIEHVLEAIATEDAVTFIIAEIPTNPRVEVPDLLKLKAVLSATRNTESGMKAIDPVFILDQTFCPNVRFLGKDEILSSVRTISYVSGSKFPSGGKCTAGYCVGNHKTNALMKKIALHLEICDNQATALQMKRLAKQLPSMNQRIKAAYLNTRAFVSYIQETLPEAKINFVSESLASQGFTPSVFSLDLPTKGATAEEREEYKRKLNHQLIQLMITEIPNESKYCVSYGQLNGVYWTIPATSTQGTTKEGDKDYIARVALSPNMDLELHKKIFSAFVATIS